MKTNLLVYPSARCNQTDTPPPIRILRHTINKRAARILLECILVYIGAKVTSLLHGLMENPFNAHIKQHQKSKLEFAPDFAYCECAQTCCNFVVAGQIKISSLVLGTIVLHMGCRGGSKISQRGRQSQRRGRHPIIWPIFPQKYMKMKTVVLCRSATGRWFTHPARL